LERGSTVPNQNQGIFPEQSEGKWEIGKMQGNKIHKMGGKTVFLKGKTRIF
jgi:hypothetical protein